MAKRTQQAVDVGGETQIATDKDGNVIATFAPLDIQATAGNEADARMLMREMLVDRLNNDEQAQETFTKWAEDHLIEIEMTDEEIEAEERMEAEAAEASADVPALTVDTFEAAIASTKPVLVDFWAQWCGPCKAAAPVLKEIHAGLADRFDIAKVNVDEEPSLSDRFGVQGIPCFIMFRSGAEVDRIIGFAPKAEFTAAIEEILAKT